MANASILLKAEAKKLGIPNYRQMDADELEAAVKAAKGNGGGTKGSASKGSAQKGSAAKGSASAAKGSTKGSGKGSAKTAPAAAKGSAKKGSAKSSPAKSAKSATKAASKKGTAKRTTAKKTGTASASKGSAKRTPAKKTTTAKPRAARKNAPARVDIDRSQIDWRAESNVGRTGKRAEVMQSLIKRKGNYDKVFDDLADRAKKFYPSKSKPEALKMLRWLINRVAYDFVMATEQHTPGERAEYGTSDATNNVRRREAREQARKEAAKAERAAKRKK